MVAGKPNARWIPFIDGCSCATVGSSPEATARNIPAKLAAVTAGRPRMFLSQLYALPSILNICTSVSLTLWTETPFLIAVLSSTSKPAYIDKICAAVAAGVEVAFANYFPHQLCKLVQETYPLLLKYCNFLVRMKCRLLWHIFRQFQDVRLDCI